MSVLRSRLLVSLSAACLGLAMTACSAPPPDEQEQAMAQSQQAAEAAAQPASPDSTAVVSGSCDAAQAQGLVGQALTDTLTEQARTDTRAKTVRVLKPNQAVTMDFNSDRLNLEVDEKDLITGVRCG